MATPWYVVAALVASTSAVVGVIWDISWHRTIGRDTFWTPAHLAIYASGIIAGLSCGWLVLKTTFAGSDAERAAGVRFWGFRGPLGAWLCIWGAMAMIVSAPFDNWWHNAYGLDVKVLSPPHVILALGFTGIELGAVLMVAALQNRAGSAARRGYGLLLVAPAVVVDLTMRRFGTGRDWRLSALLGVAFLAVLFVTQWFATMYLISPASENVLFGAHRWNYNSLPGDFEHRFWNIRGNPVTPLRLAFAAGLAMVSTRVGLWCGNGLARVQR